MIPFIRIEEIKLSLNDNEDLLQIKVVKILGIKKNDIVSLQIIKKAMDSRNKKDIFFVYSLDVTIKNQETYFKKIENLPLGLKNNIKKYKVRLVDGFIYKIKKVSHQPKNRPIVIGSGPA